jgi:hypothetical protein
MTKHLMIAAVAAGALSMSFLSFSPAEALSRSECSAKYKAAKDAGTLNGMKWNDFQKTQCAGDASAATAPAAAPAATTPKPTPSASSPSSGAIANPLKPILPRAATSAGAAVFPTAVSPKYSSESAGKQRMHTCLDQYNANKANGGNANMKWIMKGGGYYSECNKHLKGEG